ncbi:hypothetical protein JAAARDRAFT_33968 [Jaapia argillacea MUCL 33604]|uniref:Uncharacterized protein n=1 Tax=Jaapia argillacea MUCL 33604 TaxID=933084 RepID=A0A067Q9H9_9AGAM|nr:hypothetical protein JAAARDRAFT_33968 [Jaapia argillacea MUCL 33604]
MTTNNPFIDQSAAAYSRFPDIGAQQSPSPPGSGQYSTWIQPQYTQQPTQQPSPAAYPNQSMYLQQQQQPQAAWGQGVYSNPTGFQPSSSFGQQLAVGGVPQPYQNQYANGAAGYYAQPQQPQQPQFTGYASPSPYGSVYPQQGQAQAQYQTPQAYLAEFDPYSAIGQQQWSQGQQPQQQQPQTTSTTTSSHSRSPSASGSPHPRDYIRTHKPELESWDPYAWKQLKNACDTLMSAWEARKNEIGSRLGQLGQMGSGAGGWYGVDQERSRLGELLKEAQGNFNSIAASSIQLTEVFSGYRLSSDLASKRRVREAVNAAVQALPDWPPSGI